MTNDVPQCGPDTKGREIDSPENTQQGYTPGNSYTALKITSVLVLVLGIGVVMYFQQIALSALEKQVESLELLVDRTDIELEIGPNLPSFDIADFNERIKKNAREVSDLEYRTHEMRKRIDAMTYRGGS